MPKSIKCPKYSKGSGKGSGKGSKGSQYETESPFCIQTEAPTAAPTELPTELPTRFPVELPTNFPTKVPTNSPTELPTNGPTNSPTELPTNVPTFSPTELPTNEPTNSPTCVCPQTLEPTVSFSPSFSPSGRPSRSPSEPPFPIPSTSPSTSPSRSPKISNPPTLNPTARPTGLSDVTFRVMPLGDSITKGHGKPGDFPGGYRKELYRLLVNNGYNLDYIGTISNNGFTIDGKPGDPHHQGTGGTKIQFHIDAIKKGLFNKIDYPDVILLHLGTNDFGKNDDIENAIHRYEELIQLIAEKRPFSHIIATSLIVRKFSPNSSNIDDEQNNLFNVFVEDVVNRNAASGIRVSFLDMYPVVEREQLEDGIHPNQAGYDAMAVAWFGAIKKIFKPYGDSNPPEIIEATALSGTKNVIIQMSKPVADSSIFDENNFKLSNGIIVRKVNIDLGRREITLRTNNFDPLSGKLTYAIIIDGVSDRSPSKIPMLPYSVIPFTITSASPTSAPTQVVNTGGSKLRILPFGGGLIRGQTKFPGSFRKNVYNDLTDRGWSIDFVGTKDFNPANGIDPDHEGTADKFIKFYEQFAFFWLEQIEYPDIILLYVGNHDFTSNQAAKEEAKDAYGRLIQRIADIRPYAHIIATNLLVRNEPYNTDIEDYFNPFIQDIVKEKANNGVNVSFSNIRKYVKQNMLLTPAVGQEDQGYYLNQAGYNAMATGWIDAITAVSTPYGNNERPEVLTIQVTDENTVTITYTKPVANSAANFENYEISSNVSIENIVLDKEKRVITISTSSLLGLVGQTIDVTIKFVEDRLDIPNRIVKTLKTVDVLLDNAPLNNFDIRVLPYGDTLTVGHDEEKSPGGYRKPLYHLMRSAGYNLNFVGNKKTNPAEGIDPDHEGNADKFINFFEEFADVLLSKIVDTPDVILLHVGYKDFEKKRNVEEAIDTYDLLIRRISTILPSSQIIASNLLNREDEAGELIKIHFNPFVPNIVRKAASDGVRVTFLDLNSYVESFKLDPKNQYPYPAGYDSMAQGWFHGIRQIYGPSGSLGRPEIMRIATSKALNILVLTFNKAISNASARNLANYQLNNNLEVLKAVLRNDRRIVVLSTSDYRSFVGKNLRLTVSDIIDITPDKNTIETKQHVIKVPSYKVLPPSTIRVMPLGGELTVGQLIPGGYRKSLFDKMRSNGYNVDFVGSRTQNPPSGNTSDKDHEGWAEKFLVFYTRNVETWLNKILYPDVILLQAGLWDFKENLQIQGIINRYADLIIEIARVRPKSHIIATNIITQGQNLDNKIMANFNMQVVGKINELASGGIRVTFLDMRSFVTVDQLNDNFYPTQKGYNSMADGWLQAIKEVSGPEGDGNAPEMLSSVVTDSRNIVIITFSKPISDASVSQDVVKMNFVFNKGVKVISGSLDGEKRVVSLTTSNYSGLAGLNFVVTVNGVTDRTINKLEISPDSKSVVKVPKIG
eukprot:CAMPEP_0184872994 /NCGR_PEP_ID=MMETSP0580-20130426/41596_1 /TAXON_ID=1118495 /ORGANISM="Dactyliosolen fragilissimus" /LENGTH=1456 /DNA_ID=CAMNT_0027375853 /DNA_START=225 /DNA_END=4595 /DNA_ORIENTATION=-